MACDIIERRFPGEYEHAKAAGATGHFYIRIKAITDHREILRRE